MSKRSYPLEWKTDVISVSDATVTTGEFDLDLLPDEIAEIHGIDSEIRGNLLTAVIDQTDFNMYISMDPDADDTPNTLTNLEDLEVFFHHYFRLIADYAEATETGGYGLLANHHKQMWLPEKQPILVGTNFAQVVVGDASQAAQFITTVYFKRRKAGKEELYNILLKRR